jgi:prephenate dehydrogenase
MRVGVVGGGFMGVWLRRELSAHHQMLIYDVDPARCGTESLEELAKWAEVVEDLILPAETGRWSDGFQPSMSRDFYGLLERRRCLYLD